MYNTYHIIIYNYCVILCHVYSEKFQLEFEPTVKKMKKKKRGKHCRNCRFMTGVRKSRPRHGTAERPQIDNSVTCNGCVASPRFGAEVDAIKKA
jgi:hypothetical protein